MSTSTDNRVKMAKVHKVVDPHQPAEPNRPTQIPTNWDKCVVCQEITSEILHCPANSKRGTDGAGYKTISDNMSAFSAIGCLPKTVNVSHLDDGEDIKLELMRNKAKFHDSCRLRLNKTELKRAVKRKSTADDDSFVPNKFTRQTVEQTSAELKTCFFCDLPASRKSSLRYAATKEISAHVKLCATKLQDSHILAKLGVRDMVAQDAKYHPKCLVSLYNKAREKKTNNKSEFDTNNHELAFAELLSFIEESRSDSSVAPVFKMADLGNLYRDKLTQLGTVLVGRVHTTHLKERLLGSVTDMIAHKKGRDVVLISNTDVGTALEKACNHDADNDAVHLAKAAHIVRRDMADIKSRFRSSFDPQCQEQSVPDTLLDLVSMILNGTNAPAHVNDNTVHQSSLTLSQLLMFNSVSKDRPETATTTSAMRHSPERETPLPVYLGVVIHTKTRKKELVDMLFSLGLSISYDRVLSISTELANDICNFYETEKAVCPPQLRGGLFTTAAVDNIDYNPSSTTSHDSFHGTGISLFQHPSNEDSGVDRTSTVGTNGDHDRDAGAKKVAHLPESYSSVPPVSQCRQDPPLPMLDGPNKADGQLIPQAMDKEYRYNCTCNLLHNCTKASF